MKKFLSVSIIAFSMATNSGMLQSRPIEKSLSNVKQSPEFVDITDWKHLQVELRYASLNNFTGKNLYGSFNRAFLHRDAAKKLKKAIQNLQKTHPGHRFLIFDALRPRSVQWALWNHVKGTPQQRYVANPTRGSVHNYGFALDLSLADDTGTALDMGTGFDDFTPLAQPRFEQKFLRMGKISPQQQKNRALLKNVMEKAGFKQISIEWWHFNALPFSAIKKNFVLIE